MKDTAPSPVKTPTTPFAFQTHSWMPFAMMANGICITELSYKRRWMEGENLSLAAQCRLPNFGIKWLTLLGLVPILVFNSIPQSTNGIPVQRVVVSTVLTLVVNTCSSMIPLAISLVSTCYITTTNLLKPSMSKTSATLSGSGLLH